jgi:UDP-N-acetylmuramate dehydrogenase
MSLKQQSFKKNKRALSFNGLRGKFVPNASMRLYTTIKIGGPSAGVYIPEDLEDLKESIFLCKKLKISLLPIGNGSNIIVTNRALKKIFIKLSAPYFTNIVLSRNNVTAGAGVTMNRFCNFLEKNSLSGAEFLTGIPATIGGAVFQNAGAYKHDISSILKSVDIIDLYGNEKTLNAPDIGLRYRYSGFNNIIILSAKFCLKKTKKDIIRKKVNAFLKHRLSTQDYAFPSAGCVFKNPEGTVISAGAMIDKVGLKGKRIGGAEVSRKHANFIINKHKAKAEDVVRLISFVKNRVKSEYGIILETEVGII